MDSNHIKQQQQQQQSRGEKTACRRRRGAIGSLLLLAAFGGGVTAFSTPASMMTMKVDLVARRKLTSATPPPKTSAKRGGVSATTSSSTFSQLDMICQDQHEFELSVGHAMDVLRHDYPDILNHKPDFSIYDPNLELIDPSGVQLHGLKNYKASFQLLHAIVAIFYCPERSGLTFRMCFDQARQNIRIHWNARVIPKAIFGGYKTTLHVDGISVYEISRKSGNITQHRIERLLINDASVTPEQGIFKALRGHAVKSNVDSIPAFNTEVANTAAAAATDLDQGFPLQENQVFEFHNFYPGSRSLLFSSHDENRKERSQLESHETPAMMDASSMESNMDWEALEKKNTLRKKFGLDPLTPEEFVELEEQVKELDHQQQQRAAASAAELANKKKKDDGGFFKKLMGGILEDTCESNFDCESPEVCCDFGFKKMCCSSGMRVLDGPPRSRYGEWAEVPVIANPGPDYPPSDPRKRY